MEMENLISSQSMTISRFSFAKFMFPLFEIAARYTASSNCLVGLICVSMANAFPVQIVGLKLGPFSNSALSRVFTL